MNQRYMCGDLKVIRETIFRFTETLRAYDRQKGFCMECGAGPLERFHAHHVRPSKAGGGDEAENLEIVCGHHCHMKREARSNRIHGLKPNR
jgi:hypothetical protein